MSEVARRFLPLTITGFVVMVITGSLLFSAVPLHSYQRLFFRAKNGAAAAGWCERVDFSLRHLSASFELGS